MSDDQQWKDIGVPFIREWFTYTLDENGNVPPESEWVRHEVELVIVRTSDLKDKCK